MFRFALIATTVGLFICTPIVASAAISQEDLTFFLEESYGRFWSEPEKNGLEGEFYAVAEISDTAEQAVQLNPIAPPSSPDSPKSDDTQTKPESASRPE